jgi:hypothetical protein
MWEESVQLSGFSDSPSWLLSFSEPLNAFVLPSEFRLPHVFFINRALSEVPQAELNCLRNVKTGQFQAVAVGLEVIQNRTRLFSAEPVRCPCSEAGHG